MKEESEIYRQGEPPIVNGDWSYLEMGNNLGSSPSVPFPRFKHQSFYYKNRVYVHGGTTIPSTCMTDDPLDLFAYNLEGTQTKKWEWIRTKSNSAKEMEVLSGHAGVISGNKWFMFGGSNADNRPNNLLWRLNLDNYEWAKLEQRGQAPTPRESAHLFFLQKNWLMLYGGINVLEIQIYNSFHFYNMDTKNWSHCEGTYMHQAYARLDPALVLHNQHLYLFGGTYRNSSNEEKYLNDFYDIGINLPGRNLSGKVQLRRLISTVMPQNRSGHSLVGIGLNYLLLIGGQNSTLALWEGGRTDDISLVDNAWVYNIGLNLWNKLQFKTLRFRFRTMSSCAVGEQDKLYIFGGLQQYSKVLGDLIELKINPLELAQSQQNEVHCLKCEEKQLYNFEPRYYSSDLIDDMVSNIQFPFAAVGLLIDNAVLSAASLVNIHYHEHLGSMKVKLLRIEDNANFSWTEEEFVTAMSNFDAGSTVIPLGLDKKAKANLIRDNLRREFGYNIKLGSLRLGSSFLYILVSENYETIRVCLFQKQKSGNQQKYILRYYCYSNISDEVSQIYMVAVRRKVQQEYGQLIRQALSRRFIRNTLYIFNPCIADYRYVESRDECELKAHMAHNDIINGSVQDLITLEKAGYNILDCVDVSLRAYITCLYLKNETTKIYLGVKSSDPVMIQTQTYLQKVDRLCKSKHVLEINHMLQFQLKIVQLYYLYDLNKKLGYFSNGLMIYHKNRLITRYKYKLGELISRKMYKSQANHNFIRLFGFVELPDHIPINIFKTNCTYQIMMQKLYSRFKFINKILKKELKKMVMDSNLKRIAPLKITDEEMQNDYAELQLGKDHPRFKQNSNIADDSYSKRDLAQNNICSDHSNPDQPVIINKKLKLNQIYGSNDNNGLINNNSNVPIIENHHLKQQTMPRVNNHDDWFETKKQRSYHIQNQQENDSSLSSEEFNGIDQQRKEDNMPAVLIQQHSSEYQLQIVGNNKEEPIQEQNKELVEEPYNAQDTIAKKEGQIQIQQDQKVDQELNRSDQLMANPPNQQLSNHNECGNISVRVDNSRLFQLDLAEEMEKQRILNYQQALEQK